MEHAAEARDCFVGLQPEPFLEDLNHRPLGRSRLCPRLSQFARWNLRRSRARHVDDIHWILPASSKIGKYIEDDDCANDHSDNGHEDRLEEPHEAIHPACDLLIVEDGDAFHHVTHRPRPLSDGQHAQGDRRGQPHLIERLRDAAPFADAFRRFAQRSAQHRMQQARRHVQRRHDGRAAAQQHPDHAIEPGQMVGANALPDGRHLPQFSVEPLPCCRRFQCIDDACDDRGEPREHEHEVGFEKLAPFQKPHRENRKIAAEILVDPGKARHDVEHEEQAHESSYADQKHRVDRSARNLVADQIELRLVSDITRQCIAEIARRLTRAHCCHIDRRKDIGIAPQRGR